MNEPGLPAPLLALLAEARAASDGVLSLKEDPRGEEVIDLAERLTDLGLFRIVTARRYRLSDAGHAALAAKPGHRRAKTPPAAGTAGEGAGGGDGGGERKSPGLWKRLFGGKS